MTSTIKKWKHHFDIKKKQSKNVKLAIKNFEWQEIMCVDWKIQLEQVQTKGDLENDTIKHQGVLLLCKNDQGFTNTQFAPRQPLFVSLKPHAPIFKLPKNSSTND